MTTPARGRRWNYDGSRFESIASYARAVRQGDHIAVSGTVDVGPDGKVLHAGDAYQQTLGAFQKAIAAVEALGGSRADVIRTRIFLGAGEDWQSSVRAHAELFRDIDPANTSLFVSGFFIPDAIVEVEVDAVIGVTLDGATQADGHADGHVPKVGG
jgi:enamine deaminase RidA (YjgF/YER057c/UK114 family)